jgi:hypothetical protein
VVKQVNALQVPQCHRKLAKKMLLSFCTYSPGFKEQTLKRVYAKATFTKIWQLEALGP